MSRETEARPHRALRIEIVSPRCAQRTFFEALVQQDVLRRLAAVIRPRLSRQRASNTPTFAGHFPSSLMMTYGTRDYGTYAQKHFGPRRGVLLMRFQSALLAGRRGTFLIRAYFLVARHDVPRRAACAMRVDIRKGTTWWRETDR